MKVDVPVETYQAGAHFKALIKAILVAPSRILENFLSFHVSRPRCGALLTLKIDIATCKLLSTTTYIESGIEIK